MVRVRVRVSVWIRVGVGVGVRVGVRVMVGVRVSIMIGVKKSHVKFLEGQSRTTLHMSLNINEFG